MKLLFAFAAVISAMLTARADVIVYKIAGTERDFGSNQDIRYSAPGWVVWDVDNSEFQILTSQTLGGKQFWVNSVPVQFREIVGPNGKIGLGFSWSNSSTNGTAFIMGCGYNSSLALSDTRLISIPKTLTCNLLGFVVQNQGDAKYEAVQYSLIFSPKDTQNANSLHETISDVMGLLQSKYIGMGYTQKRLAK